MRIEVTAKGYVGIESGDGKLQLHNVCSDPSKDFWGYTEVRTSLKHGFKKIASTNRPLAKTP
jgi:hypothetical protein